MTLLFSTPHGSHLYGLAHEGSDEASFEVYENKIGRTKAKTAKQSIVGDEDIVRTDLSTFILYASKGVPQYLEARDSQVATEDKLGELYRYNFRPNLWEAIHTYRRTIKGLWMKGDEFEDGEKRFKFRRHAWRLAWNLGEVERGNYFNPTLEKDKIRYSSVMSMTGTPPFEMSEHE